MAAAYDMNKLLLSILFTTLLGGVNYGKVICISVDGLRSDAIVKLGPKLLPGFYRFRTEGAFTDHARCDEDLSLTLPNHLSMVTGRMVMTHPGFPRGHGVTVNGDWTGRGLHTRFLPDGGSVYSYVSSMFDVASKSGLNTGLYVQKDKLIVFNRAFGPLHITDDNGETWTGAIKISHLDGSNATSLLSTMLRDLEVGNLDLTLLHFKGPDSAGHRSYWTGFEDGETFENHQPVEDATNLNLYFRSIVEVDNLLVRLFAEIERPIYEGKIRLILTSDHGGSEEDWHGHQYPDMLSTAQIPFYVWGEGVQAGADLYQMNPDYLNPRNKVRGEQKELRTIRNGMVANLALSMLDLPPVPGSYYNFSQQFKVAETPNFREQYPELLPQGDDNQNGHTNEFEWLLGSDPREDLNPQFLPRMDGEHLVLHHRKPIEQQGLILEVSEDFSNDRWEVLSLPDVASVEVLTEGYRTKIRFDQTQDKALFYRQRLIQE